MIAPESLSRNQQTRGASWHGLPAIAEDVCRGLSRQPKSLPPKLFYDEAGSQLFDEITTLPEYYLTRTERSLLQQYAGEILDAFIAGTSDASISDLRFPISDLRVATSSSQRPTLAKTGLGWGTRDLGRGAGNSEIRNRKSEIGCDSSKSRISIVELGAGNAEKTTLLLRALLEQQGRATYYPVDVCREVMLQSRRRLRVELPGLWVEPIVADYTLGLPELSRISERKLVLSIGSSLGNFEPMEASTLLHAVRRSLAPGDALLLGVDLVKDASVLLPAYDDAAGVTARFNKNILARINRELGGHFDLDSFRHLAKWNREESRIEIYLESLRAQRVPIDLLQMCVTFEAGERIHTENSYKFTPGMIDSILHNGGFRLERRWTDEKGWFGVHLARVE